MELTDDQMRDKVIKDAQMSVLEEVGAGKKLNRLEKSILSAMLANEIRTCDEVQRLLRELNTQP